jgi:pilus assembly protein Flp/PilA
MSQKPRRSAQWAALSLPRTRRALRRLYVDETGADLVEWGLVVALIAIVALVAVAAFGGDVADMFETIADTVNNTP